MTGRLLEEDGCPALSFASLSGRRKEDGHACPGHPVQVRAAGRAETLAEMRGLEPS
jgi:hypothetical protein